MIGRKSNSGSPEDFRYFVRFSSGRSIKCFGKADAEKIRMKAARSGALGHIVRVPVSR